MAVTGTLPSPSSSGRPRFGLREELLLAALPAIAVLLVFGLVEHFTRQRLLFASLASSAFLIYLDPHNTANHTKTLVVAQVAAALIGFAVLHVLGPGYPAAAVAMTVTTVVMIAANVVHPPAVATSLAFAFKGTDDSNLALFVVSVVLVATLVALQHAMLWLVARAVRRSERSR